MSTDYKKLCFDLFGTTDVDKLSEIASNYNKKNPRGAGRKVSFSDEQISEMKKMQANGVSQQKIAEHFSTTRQTVARLLSQKNSAYNMRIDYMYKTSVCTTIFVDFLNSSISIINKTPDIIHRAFGIVESPTWKDFEEFLESRCFPKSRGDRKTLLNILGLDSYDPIQIIEKTKGKTYEDNQWMKISYGR